MSENKFIQNSLEKGMYRDAIPSLQPEGTYRFALNAIHETDDASGFGLANEESNVLCASLPDGYQLRGSGFIEERNSYIVFSYNPKEDKSEIGIISLAECSYGALLKDSNLDCNLCFDTNEWIRPEFKSIEPCGEIEVYWSNKDEYKYFNIDQCDAISTCSDISLLSCECTPEVTLTKVPVGTSNLKAGTYQFAIQLEDSASNTTNVFWMSTPLSIGSDTNQEDGLVSDAVRINLNSLSEEYTKVIIYIAKKSDGILTTHKLPAKPYVGNSFSYTYRGDPTNEIAVDINAITTKNDNYIKGRDLKQIDGRLYLYNIRDYKNFDYQRTANNIVAEYVVYEVEGSKAGDYKSRMRDEVYADGIVWNYCDGTHSPVYHIPGRAPTKSDREIIEARDNCSECDKQRWRVENTASRTELFGDDICLLSDSSYGISPDNGNRTCVEELVLDTGAFVTNFRNIDYDDIDSCCYASFDAALLVEQANWNNLGIVVDIPPCYVTNDFTLWGPDHPTILAEIQTQIDAHILANPDYAVTCANQPADFSSTVTNYTIKHDIIPTWLEYDLGGGDFATEQVYAICYSVEISTFYKYGFGGAQPEAPIGNTGVLDPVTCTRSPGELPKHSIGKPGYWESTEKYPLTKDHNGEYIYGDLAGLPIRHHRMPCNTLEPHFYSSSNGVASHINPEIQEEDGTYVYVLGMRYSNIKFPTDTPKPLCPNKPYTIVTARREGDDKSVIAKGMFTGTYKGYVEGTAYTVPNHAVNSLEHVEGYSGVGSTHDIAAYNFHSPDTAFDRPSVSANQAKIDMELWGGGRRFGLYAEGKKPDSPYATTIHNVGTRQAIAMNHFKCLPQTYKCVRDSSYLPTDGILSKGSTFTYPVLNLFRESSVFLELDDDKLTFTPGTKADIDQYLTDGMYGGDYPADQTGDGSFMGDTMDHDAVINHARAWYGSLRRENPSQYGGLENMIYYDAGMDIDYGCYSCIDSPMGDVYITKYDFRRTSYISKDVGPSAYKGEGTTGSPSFKRKIRKFFKGIFDWLTKGLDVRTCDDVPEDGDTNDQRNTYGFRGDMRKWDGYTPFIGATLAKTYPPRVLKTNISFWVESVVNNKYRRTLSEEEGEVYYSNTGGLSKDSSFTNHELWANGYLNRFYCEKETVARWRLIAGFIFNFFIGIFIPIRVAVALIGLSVPGALISVAIVLFIFSITSWILNGGLRDILLESILGIPNCNDKDGVQDEGCIKQFEDNFYSYDYSHSDPNEIDVYVGLPDPFNTDPCLSEVGGKILYSDRQILGSSVNAYKIFRANNEVEIPASSGSIQNVFMSGNNIYVHTTDNIWNLFYNQNQLQLGTESIFLGRGDLLSEPRELNGNLAEGYAGTIDPNASINTPIGYVFIDRKGADVSVMTDKITQLSDGAMRHFFQENMSLKLLEQYPDFKCVDEKSIRGIGFNIGFDYRHNRLLITKVDYEVKDKTKVTLSEGKYFTHAEDGIIHTGDPEYFCNRGFTISYSVAEGKWISFHSYIPQAYIWNRDKMYSFKNGGLWKHDSSPDSFQTYYGKYYPHIIELVGRDVQAFEYKSTIFDTEAYTFNTSNCTKITNLSSTFNKMVAFNSYQATPELSLVYRGNGDTSIGNTKDIAYISRVLGSWRLNGLKNYLKSQPIYSECGCTEDYIDKVIVGLYNSSIPEMYNNSILFDKYIIYRLTLDNFADKNVRLLTKHILTYVNNPTQ